MGNGETFLLENYVSKRDPWVGKALDNLFMLIYIQSTKIIIRSWIVSTKKEKGHNKSKFYFTTVILSFFFIDKVLLLGEASVTNTLNF